MLLRLITVMEGDGYTHFHLKKSVMGIHLKKTKQEDFVVGDGMWWENNMYVFITIVIEGCHRFIYNTVFSIKRNTIIVIDKYVIL